MRSPQIGARARAPWPPPVELDAEGQALREQLRALKRIFPYLVLNSQLTSSGVLMRHFRCCRGNDKYSGGEK
jgi:hypothetical protein